MKRLILALVVVALGPATAYAGCSVSASSDLKGNGVVTITCELF